MVKSCKYLEDCWLQAPVGMEFNCVTCWRTMKAKDWILRDIKRDDFENLYSLLKERDITVNISHKSLPSFEEHSKFWDSNPYPWVQAIVNINDFIGYCYLTDKNEIGIFLTKEYQGLGIGTAVIKMIVEKNRGKRLLANINPLNKKSRRLFKGLGFNLVQLTYELDSFSRELSQD